MADSSRATEMTGSHTQHTHSTESRIIERRVVSELYKCE